MRVSTTAVAAALGATAVLASLAGPAGASTATGSAADWGRHQVRLDGQQEVPGPGDPDGHGRFGYTIKGDKLCYKLNVSDIDTPTAAHIHVGPSGEAGPVTVTLRTPPTNGTVHDCIRARQDQTPSNAARVLTFWELEGIKQNPFFFYTNVHTRLFPNGAIRGQL